ncbi:MAG: hypothetical protein K0V04_27900 [Deltaproteobacteria bacterium]|nr:hypothetical protein [Deltaproteobacteria bacterium]
MGCAQDVDDPANFTVGNSMGMNTSSSGSGTAAATTTGGPGNGATSTTGTVDSSGGGVNTTGPVDDNGNNGNCGNGVIDAGEQCDGADLQNFDCQSLGLNGGTLACDQMMCTFDTSMCSSDPGGTSG